MKDKIERKVKTVNPTRKVKLREGNKTDRKNSFFFTTGLILQMMVVVIK